jgi:hypothetical protein
MLVADNYLKDLAFGVKGGAVVGVGSREHILIIN